MSTRSDLSLQRLHRQRLLGEPFASPVEALRDLGAAQAQEYALAKWSLGQRSAGATDDRVERALSEGTILRTHALRPTWHFVLPEDLRWIQALTGPRVHAYNAHYYRKMELDDAVLATSRRVITRALAGSRYLTRQQLAGALREAGIQAEGPRLAFIIMHAELDAVVCNGPRSGKQHTYALVDERVPPAPSRSRDEVLAELTVRYFSSHGPATEKDFRWWSSLKAADVREGLALAGGRLERMTIGERTYWFTDASLPASVDAPVARLLQVYDESVVAYSESRDAFDADGLARAIPESHNRFVHPLLIDGQLAGMWRRVLKGRSAHIEVRLGRDLDEAEQEAVHREAARFGAFAGVTASVVHA